MARAPNLGGNVNRCIRAMQTAAGRQLSEEEMIGIGESLQKRIDRERRVRGSASDQTLYREASQQMRVEHEADKMLRRRNRNINISRYAELQAELGKWANPAEGLRAILVGGHQRIAGARYSIDYAGKGIASGYYGAFKLRLSEGAPQDRLLALWDSGAKDLLVARELEAMAPGPSPTAGGVTGDGDAFQIARAMHDTSEDIRQRSNRAGAWIAPRPGWIMRQSHNGRAIEKAGFQAWRDTIDPLLDEQTFTRRQSRVDVVEAERTALTQNLNQLNSMAPQLNAVFAEASKRMADALAANLEARGRAAGLQRAVTTATAPLAELDVARAKAGRLAGEMAEQRAGRAADLEVAGMELREGAAAEAAATRVSIEQVRQGAQELRAERDAKLAEFRESINSARKAKDRAEVKRLRAERDRMRDDYTDRIDAEEERLDTLRAARTEEAADFRSAIRQAAREKIISEDVAAALETLQGRIERMGKASDEWRLEKLTRQILRDYARVMAKMDVTARQALQIQQHMGPAIATLNQLADQRRQMTQRLSAAEKASDDLAGAGQVSDREEFLRAVYNDIISGRRQDAPGAFDWTSGVGGSSNLAMRESRERVLHFRDADAWMAYHKIYGVGNFKEGFARGVMRGSRNIALWERLGPNPEMMFNRMRQKAMADHHGDPAVMRALDDPGLKGRMDEVMGHNDADVTGWLADTGRVLRGWNVLSKLGGMMVSSIGDTATYAREAQYQGKGFFTPYAEALGDLVRGRGAADQRRMLDLLGAGLEGFSGELGASMGSLDGTPGTMSRLLQRFYTLSLQSWWTDVHKGGMSMMVSRQWGQNKDTEFAALDFDERRLMELYNVTANDWNLFRASRVEAMRGRDYLVPRNIREVDHAAVETWAGRAVTTLEAQRIRDRVADRFQTLLADRADFAVATPGADERYMMYGGNRPGTPVGEAMRFLLQFKAYPLTVTNKLIFGREIRGADSRIKAFTGLTSLILQMAVMGYLTGASKDIIRGKEPRDPLAWQTWMNALLQGGGAGIYGDFLFGDFSRFGRSSLETLMGPVPGVAADIFDMASWARKGELRTSDVVRFTAANTPFANLFYLKPVLDYGLLYPLYDSLNPGYLQRMEQRTREQNKQDFWLPPSRVSGGL